MFRSREVDKILQKAALTVGKNNTTLVQILWHLSWVNWKNYLNSPDLNIINYKIMSWDQS